MDNGRKSLGDLIFKVVFLFLGFELFWFVVGTFVYDGLWKSLLYGKYGWYFFCEGVILGFALILLFLTGKLNILKKKRLKFKDALKLGIPIVVLSMIVLVANVGTLDIKSLNIHNLISLILYSGAIGFFEEILFRGVILGELLDGYGNTRKQVVISIIISSVIFSLTHITNLLAGQDMLTTMMQIIQTFAIGFLFGLMYYVSGNIWSVIFLHGFYDFSILIGDVNLIKDCTMSSVPISITISSLITSLILSAIYILYSFTVLNRKRVKEVLKEEVLESDIEHDKKFGSKLINGVWFLVGGFFIFNVLSNVVLDDNSSNYNICYEYEKISLKNIETHYYAYDDYTITALNDLGLPINYHLYLSDSKAYLNGTDLGIENVERVVSFDNQILIIAVDDNTDYKVYYSDFTKLDLNNISNSFKIFTLPDIAAVGYIVADNVKYPLLKSTVSDLFVLKDNKVMLVEE